MGTRLAVEAPQAGSTRRAEEWAPASPGKHPKQAVRDAQTHARHPPGMGNCAPGKHLKQVARDAQTAAGHAPSMGTRLTREHPKQTARDAQTRVRAR